jgi:hypothetical protein
MDLSLLVALSLLIGPELNSYAGYEHISFHVDSILLQEEVVDKRELHYLLHSIACADVYKQEYFTDTFLRLKTRYDDLKFVPKLQDVSWLPNRETCMNLHNFNISVKEVWEIRKDIYLHKRDDITSLLQELENRYETYRIVEEISCEHYFNYIRRYAIKRLIERIGWDFYYYYKLPDIVPLEVLLHDS